MYLGSIVDEVNAEKQAHAEKTGEGKMNMEVDMSWIKSFDEHLDKVKQDIPVVPACLSNAHVDLWATCNTEVYNTLMNLIDDERGNLLASKCTHDHLGIMHHAYAALCMFGDTGHANCFLNFSTMENHHRTWLRHCLIAE